MILLWKDADFERREGMGLTNGSVGKSAIDSGLIIKRKGKNDKVIALAGNPNVGKSTVFNALTGMNQHTGNWPGKTVASAQGYCERNGKTYIFVDIPGTYSLMAHSAEEEIARNFICFGDADAIVVVCDATCLERNLNLLLQTLEITENVILCVNLIDEAKKKHIKIDLEKLSQRLGIPVVGTVARRRRTLEALVDEVDRMCLEKNKNEVFRVRYCEDIERAVGKLEAVISAKKDLVLDPRWLSLRLLDPDGSLLRDIGLKTGKDIENDSEIKSVLEETREDLQKVGLFKDTLRDSIVSSIVDSAEDICRDVVVPEKSDYNERDMRIDRILTGRFTAYPFMILLLAVVFWLTISGANYPSELLSRGLFYLGDRLYELLVYLNIPLKVTECLVFGIYKVLAWVVSVMLPPMAIFFPLFTLLEDCGYLPRIAYNLDRPFRACRACGKQALTMCMGFGCNAAGIVGCRIIDSPRERLLAVLTNSLVLCNGRFPALIAVMTMFFIGASSSISSGIISALLLTVIILLGVAATFALTFLLSKTLLRGIPSSFTLELPPFRRPQIGKVIIRSVFDRTLFVLGRAVAFSAPAGFVIWILANTSVNDISLLSHISCFLDPFARIMGLDGVILLAFILGFPANEIVIPIIIMSYLAQGSILELESLSMMKELFVENGWSIVTAICFVLFSLFHWPCSTTLMTVKKETGELRWTLLAAVLPTAVGIICCIAFSSAARIFM